jgi:hypothetical protein
LTIGSFDYGAAVVADGFHDAESVQTNADTARKHHGKPFVIVKGGFFVVATEFHVFVLCTQKIQDEDKPDILRDDVQPRKVTRDPPRPTRHFARRPGLVDEHPDDEAPEQGGRERGGDPVDAQHLRRAGFASQSMMDICICQFVVFARARRQKRRYS